MATDPQLVDLVWEVAEKLIEGAAPKVVEDIKRAAPCVTTMNIPNSIRAEPGFQRTGRGVTITIRQDASGAAFYGPILNNPPAVIRSKSVRNGRSGGILTDGAGFFTSGRQGQPAEVEASQKYKGWWDDHSWNSSFCSAINSTQLGAL